MLSDFELEVEQVRDLGEVTLARMRARGHGAGSAAPLEEVIWQVGRWRRGSYTLGAQLHEGEGSPGSRRAVGVGDPIPLASKPLRWATDGQRAIHNQP